MGLDIFEHTPLPRMARVRQSLDATDVGDIGAAVHQAFAAVDAASTIKPGAKVALTAGSRGIDRVAEVLTAAVAEVRALGGEPFIVPAMGSHGGATAAGQTEVIAHYGVTEDAVGAPIRASMETVQLGTVPFDNGDSVPVWFDRTAYEQADVVIPVGRVKPHTDFRGPAESGLMKMIAIGLGKQQGASTFHGRGIHHFGRLIPLVAQYTLAHVNIPFGLALIENGYGHLALIEAVPAAAIPTREPELLDIARARMARLPRVEMVDVLVVDRIGKDISGDGADPNVVNRAVVSTIDFTDARPIIQRLVVRDLTDDTEGNATGIGMFDFALRRAVERMDPLPTYMNMITAKSPAGARIPITVDTDREALQLAIASALNVPAGEARIVRIEDTKNLEYFLASEPLLPALEATGAVEVLDAPEEIRFDAAGMFASAVAVPA